MAQYIDITKVTVTPTDLTARVVVSEDGPLTTDEDLMGTTAIYRLLPKIVDHACLGDAGTTFKDAMPATEIAHLLEHVTIELMAQTNMGDDVYTGRTRAVPGEERTYDVQLACPDDVLTTLCLSSAAWLCQWAYSGAPEPGPDVDAIVDAIAARVDEENGIAPAGEPAPEAESQDEASQEPEADEAPDVDDLD